MSKHFKGIYKLTQWDFSALRIDWDLLDPMSILIFFWGGEYMGVCIRDMHYLLNIFKTSFSFFPLFLLRLVKDLPVYNRLTCT